MMNREKPKTYQIKSFGCQMNVYDGERMGEMLSGEGMTAAGFTIRPGVHPIAPVMLGDARLAQDLARALLD